MAFERNGPTNRVVFHHELFSVAVATEQLLGPVVDRFVVHDRQAFGEDLFDRVLVADSATGQVIFEYGLDSTTIANLDDLLGVRSSGPSDSKAGAGQAGGTASGDQGEEKTEGGQKPKDTKPGKPNGSPSRPGRGSSSVSTISIAETDHKLFLQPIELTVPRFGPGGEDGYKLIVCGLVRSEYLTKKTFSFSYTLLLLTVLLVLMTTVSGPLIKLRLLGPKDRLRKAERSEPPNKAQQ